MQENTEGKEKREPDKIIKEKSSCCLSISRYNFHSSRRYQRFINEQGVFVKSGCHDKYLAEVQHSSAQLRLITRQPCYVPAALIYASYLVLHHVQDPSIVSYDTRNCRKSQRLRKPRCITITRFILTISCYNKGKYKRANMCRVFINQCLISKGAIVWRCAQNVLRNYPLQPVAIEFTTKIMLNISLLSVCLQMWKLLVEVTFPCQ